MFTSHAVAHFPIARIHLGRSLSSVQIIPLCSILSTPTTVGFVGCFVSFQSWSGTPSVLVLLGRCVLSHFHFLCIPRGSGDVLPRTPTSDGHATWVAFLYPRDLAPLPSTTAWSMSSSSIPTLQTISCHIGLSWDARLDPRVYCFD